MASCWQVGRNNKKAKKPKENQGFLVSRPSNFEAKFNKKPSPDRSKFKQKFGQHLDSIFNGFWRLTWVQDPPKTRPEMEENRCKMGFQINENFVCFLRGLLIALGANMVPKSFQNGARWGVESARCFRAWNGLGGVLGPPEP